MTKMEIKNKIESETGLKISVRKQSLNSSMRGYLTFSTCKKKGVYPVWGFAYSQKLLKEFAAPEPNPTFCDNSQLNIYKED
jgi:hypothetical protein